MLIFISQFSKYVNVTSHPKNCSELKLNKSLACRVPKKFTSLYNQAVKQLQQKITGVVITKTKPLNKGKKKKENPLKTTIIYFSLLQHDSDARCINVCLF